MRNFTKKYIALIACTVVLAITAASCSKDKYYQDGGLADPKFNGTVLQYLQSNPVKFDSIVQVIKLAGMEDVFSNESITFFAPTDEVIRRTIGLVNSVNVPYISNASPVTLNQRLFNLNKDTIRQLSDVPPVIWRKYLSRYIIKGKYLMKDFPQLDFDLRPLFPGGYYYGYNGDLLNVGVVFNSANTVRYAGYRQLCIAPVVDPSNPSQVYFSSAPVATSDVQPSNGVVHVLAQYVQNTTRLGDIRLDAQMMNVFGMWYDFSDDVVLNK
jgi:uncharacterized surface protein with fasciclin (FAS1) repeats